MNREKKWQVARIKSQVSRVKGRKYITVVFARNEACLPQAGNLLNPLKCFEDGRREWEVGLDEVLGEKWDNAIGVKLSIENRRPGRIQTPTWVEIIIVFKDLGFKGCFKKIAIKEKHCKSVKQNQDVT